MLLPMASDPDGRDRLATLVKQARLDRRLSIAAAAKLGGCSDKAWMRVEAGDGVRDQSYRDVEHALGWAAGTCQQILDGNLDGSPPAYQAVEIEMDDPSIRTVVATMQELTDDDRRRLAVLARAYLQSARDDITAANGS